MERRVIPIRASSFGRYFDCAYAWEGEHLLKLDRRGSLRAWMGTSIHAGTAAFDQARLDGAPISADDAAGVLVDTFTNPTTDVDLRDPKLTLKEAHRIAITLLTMYCNDIAPAMQYESVERPLAPLEVDCGDGLVIRLTGTMDRARVRLRGEDKIIADVKTGGRLFVDGQVSVKGRAAQLGIYQLLSEHTDGENTDGAQIIALQTTTKPLAGVSHTFDAKRMMLGDDGHSGLLEIAAKMFKAGVFPPNPQSSLCSKKYCARWGTCKYHD